MAKEFVNTRRKLLIAELGGKNPVIVTETADIDKAVDGVLKATFGYSGQKCSACSRVYLHKEVRDEFLRDRKSTRLNSSHANISYAVFCLKKKKNKHRRMTSIVNDR